MSFKHIVVPIDGSDISFAAAEKAAILAKAFNSKVTVISLINEDPFTDADFYYGTAIMREYFHQAHDNAKNAIAKAKTIFLMNGIEAETKIIEGDVSASHITAIAEELHVDLIVIGSHGRKGVQKFLLGSFAHDVLQSTQLPIMIIKQ